MKTETKTFIQFMYPGLLFSDTSEKEVKSRQKPRTIPDGVFGYRFFDVEYAYTEDGEVLKGKQKNRSPIHYFGTMMTREEIKKLAGVDESYKILYSNMLNNGYERVVMTKFGTSYPLEADDTFSSDR